MLFQFAHTEYLFLLLLIPIILVLYILSNQYKIKLFKQYGNITLLNELMPDRSTNRPTLKIVLLLISLAFFILALAGPQFASKLKERKVQGVEIVIALDVSNSMMATDIEPSRLDRAKQAISKMVDRLKNDKIGLIVFAGEAMTQIPITADYVSAKMFLNSISPDMVPVQGTAIGKAIKLASVSFSPDASCDKAIVIITDGENHEDDALEAVKEAREKGQYIYTIGIGSPKPTPITFNKGGQKDFFRDNQGQVVMTRIDEALLEKIAAEGKGTYVRASNTQLGLNTVFDKIKTLKKAEFEEKNYTEYDNQYQWPLAIALLFLFVELLIYERKTKWSEKFNLFQVKI